MTKINILIVMLTLISYWSILSIVRKRHKKSFSKVIGSQKDIHNLLKVFTAKPTNKKRVSQLYIHQEKNRIDVLVVGSQAYWISNNVFYTSEIVDGQIDQEATKPIDTLNMPKEEIDKMLFIIDSLKNGNKNDSSGAGY